MFHEGEDAKQFDGVDAAVDAGLLDSLDKHVNRRLSDTLPKDIDVQIKLPAFHRTTVEAECRGNKLVRLEVVPSERKRDVVLMGCLE